MEDANCPICLEEVSDPRLCNQCSQIFCAQCIATYFQNKSQYLNCPTCRGLQEVDGYIKGHSVEKLVQSLKMKSQELKQSKIKMSMMTKADTCPSHENEQRVFYCTKQKRSICRKCCRDCGEVHLSIEDARENAEKLWNTMDVKNPDPDAFSQKLQDLRQEMKRKANSRIAQVVEKMPERVEKEIDDKTKPIMQAIEKWKAFQAEHRDKISAIEKAKKSVLLNRMADLQPLVEEVCSRKAEVKQSLPLRSTINLNVDVDALMIFCMAEERPIDDETSAPFLEKMTTVAGTA